jgi:dihydroorotate dehydrogenase
MPSNNYQPDHTMYKSVLKPLLFLFAPETAHKMTMQGLKILLNIPLMRPVFRSRFSATNKNLQRHLMGLLFRNPIGLAAGFDKDGSYYTLMNELGFGFIEIGTVTPKAQDGNPKPRLFRLPADEALINRMGFNNAGADALAARLQKRGKPEGMVIGINIGKNKVTPNEEALQDYVYCFEKLFDFADYFAVNVSSPNTPDLRALQDKEPLTKLLGHLQLLNNTKKAPKPILLKIAPDLNDEQLTEIVEIVALTKIAGVIATNTTISRSALKTDWHTIDDIGAGGLSGKPVAQRSTEIIRFLRDRLPAGAIIIGVGGICNAADAIEKITAGADLLQVYTGLVYEGPTLVKKILQRLSAKS